MRFRPLLAALALFVGMLAGPLAARADTPDEQLAAASALFDAKRYADCAQRLGIFLANNPKHKRFGTAALVQARCFTELKLYAKAIPAYEKALATKDPSITATAQLGLGEASVYEKQYEKAVPALEAALATGLTYEQAGITRYWLAQANFALKRYDAAEAAYLQVIKDHPRVDFLDSAYLGAGLSQLKQGETEAARQSLRTVLDRFPRSTERAQARLLLAQADLEVKRYAEARSGFETILRDTAAKPSPEVTAAAEDGLIQVLLAVQDYNAATGRLESALARLAPTDPQRFHAQLSLGHCRYRQKSYEPALAAYSEAAKASDPAVIAEALYWAGNAALALERPADAAARFSKLAATYPKHELAAKSQLKAADALTAAKQGPAAAAAYRAVVARFPQSPEAAEAKKALAELVDTATDVNQVAEALKGATAAERARGTIRLARLKIEGKKYGEAAASLAELLKTKPEPPLAAEAQYLLGAAYDAQKQAAPAAAAYQAAVTVAPSAEWAGAAQGRLAWLYLDLKKPAFAEKAANAALAAKPAAEAEQQARLALLQAQLDQKKWAEVQEGCRAILAASPDAETVATVLYTQAWAAEQQGKLDDALPLWERLAAEFPKSPNVPEALLRVGDARLKAKQFEDARAKYADLLAAAPRGPLATEARFKLGSCLFNLDRPADAVPEFDAVAADKAAGDLVPEALYWAGVALDKAGQKAAAIQRLDRLVTGFPKHSRVANARIRLAALKAVSTGQ